MGKNFGNVNAKPIAMLPSRGGTVYLLYPDKAGSIHGEFEGENVALGAGSCRLKLTWRGSAAPLQFLR